MSMTGLSSWHCNGAWSDGLHYRFSAKGYNSQHTSKNAGVSDHHASGRAWESVGYTTNGEADDWGWGDQRAASLTIEVGSSQDGFWPPPSRSCRLARRAAMSNSNAIARDQRRRNPLLCG
jgi:hypothetical protein